MQPNQLALKTAFLVAFDSPKQAFYVLWIEAGCESFRVCKVSGAKGRIWHHQAWEFDTEMPTSMSQLRSAGDYAVEI